MIGDLLSFLSGTSLLIISALVVIAYRPKGWSLNDAPGLLAIAIALSFIAAAGNTLFWQVFGQPAVAWGLISIYTLRNIGDYADVAFKGGAAVAGLLHLRALKMALPSNERDKWSVFEVAFYPRRWTCLRLSVQLIRQTIGGKKDG